MSTTPESDFNLDLHFLPSWAKESPKTLEQLVEQRLLYPPGYESLWAVSAEARTISQHLDELLADGRVQVDAQGVYHPS